MNNNIFAICGEANAGKDTVFAIIKLLKAVERTGRVSYFLNEEKIKLTSRNYNALTELTGIYQLRFADPIKHCIAGFLGCTIDDLSSQEFKSLVLPENWYTTEKSALNIRDLHTLLGDGIKQIFNQDIFASATIELAKKRTAGNTCLVFITDLRFPNEYEYCKQNNIPVIKVVRPGSSLDINHNSEKYIKDIDTPYIIRNDGSLWELAIKVDSLMRELGIINTTENFLNKDE